MEQKVLSEEQMRKYIESEVRNALLSEGIDEGQLYENINDEGFLNWLSKITGIGNGQGISMEGIVGAILGRIAIKPILEKLLNVIGIPTDKALGQFILKRVSEVGGYSLGQWVDRKWDPIGADNGGLGRLLGGGGSTSLTGGNGSAGSAVGGGSR